MDIQTIFDKIYIYFIVLNNGKENMKTSLSIIGIGAFGEFIIKHVTPYFKTKIFDVNKDISQIAKIYNVDICNSIEEAAKSDIVIIAVPVRAIDKVTKQIACHLKKGQLVMDVASVKCLPAEIMSKNIPEHVDLVGLHPLFGPQSGKDGIAGLNIVVTNIRGNRADDICYFLSKRANLNVIKCTPEEHDLQMAYVQGLTHMIGKIFQLMDIPEINQETKTFSLLQQMVDMIKDDSDELFRAIQTDNPYVKQAKKKFFDSVKKLENDLS